MLLQRSFDFSSGNSSEISVVLGAVIIVAVFSVEIKRNLIFFLHNPQFQRILSGKQSENPDRYTDGEVEH